MRSEKQELLALYLFARSSFFAAKNVGNFLIQELALKCQQGCLLGAEPGAGFLE